MYFSLHSVYSATEQVLTGRLHYSAFSSIHISSDKTHSHHHSFGRPTWPRIIIGHQPGHSNWSRDAMGPKLRQSEALSRTFLTGATGEESLLPNLAKGVTPKQWATLSHIIWRNLRKKEEAQIMLQAVSQVPELPRCPDAVNCKPTHQSSVPLSSWSWPSITSYWKSWTTILSKYSYWAETIHWALWRYTAKDSFHLQRPWVLRI